MAFSGTLGNGSIYGVLPIFAFGPVYYHKIMRALYHGCSGTSSLGFSGGTDIIAQSHLRGPVLT